MQTESDHQKILNINFEAKALPLGNSLKHYTSVFQGSFQNVETAFIELQWPKDQEEIFQSLFSESLTAEELNLFLTSFFRNPSLLKTPLESAGIGAGFKVQTPFQKIATDQVALKFAEVLENAGWYEADDMEGASAQALGLKLVEELFGAKTEKLVYFFNDFGSWSLLFESWSVMATFLVFDPADRTITVLHMSGDQ